MSDLTGALGHNSLGTGDHGGWPQKTDDQPDTPIEQQLQRLNHRVEDMLIFADAG